MDNAIINKISDSEMEVIKSAQVIEPVKNVYSIDFLKNQELSILKSMNDFISQRQFELDEIRNLISEAEKLGLKTLIELQSEQVIVEAKKLSDSLN